MHHRADTGTQQLVQCMCNELHVINFLLFCNVVISLCLILLNIGLAQENCILFILILLGGILISISECDKKNTCSWGKTIIPFPDLSCGTISGSGSGSGRRGIHCGTMVLLYASDSCSEQMSENSASEPQWFAENCKNLRIFISNNGITMSLSCWIQLR